MCRDGGLDDGEAWISFVLEQEHEFDAAAWIIAFEERVEVLSRARVASSNRPKDRNSRPRAWQRRGSTTTVRSKPQVMRRDEDDDCCSEQLEREDHASAECKRATATLRAVAQK
jgi:hypothetical protein